MWVNVVGVYKMTSRKACFFYWGVITLDKGKSGKIGLFKYGESKE